MKEFIKKHAKAYMILSICLLIGVVGISYAYYAASVSNDTVVVGQAGGGALPLLTISKVSTEANGNLIPIDMNKATLTKAASASPKCVDNNGYSSCQIYSVTVQNNSSIPQSYNVELTRLFGANTPNVDAVTMGTSDSIVENIASIKDKGLICKTNSVSNGDTTTPCYFMVLIKNLDTAQDDNGTFTGTVTITSGAGAELKANFGKGEKVTTTIENLYNNASKSTVTNNGITYNYASSVSLMNDRLGNSSVGLDDGNIRYYGASPNNYIDIGDVYDQDVEVKNWVKPMQMLNIPIASIPTTSSSCKEFVQCSNLVAGGLFNDVAACETELPYLIQSAGYSSVNELCSTSIIPAGTTKSLYRIIGLFKDVELSNGTKKDLIKVIRNNQIGAYSWDQTPEEINNGHGINEWSQADLMKLLNPGYEAEVGGSLYWNNDSGTCYGMNITTSNLIASCDFTNDGLSINVKNKIETVKWNLGGNKNREAFVNEVYGYERGTSVLQNPSDGIERTTIWSGKIAIPYISDYGYATDLKSCNFNLYSYGNNACTSTNWMHDVIAGAPTWFLTPYSGSVSFGWSVDSLGSVDYDDYFVSDAILFSPVFYLDAEQTIGFGTGASKDPYLLQ